MSDPIFPELEADDAAIAAFNETQISRTEAAFCDAQFDADVGKAAKIMEDPDNLGGVIRRGKWLYNYHRNADHPRGLWRRLPEDTAPTPDAAWEPVFDLDAFCAETDEDWHWRGAPTLWSNPDRVLIALSHQGSDQTRYLEWDCNAAAAVTGGFDIAPARSGVDWLDADTLLLSTAALPGSATRSGWQGRVVQLSRGMALADAPVIFEVDHDDLQGGAYSYPLRGGGRGIGLRRARAIGDVISTLRVGGTDIILDAPRNTHCTHSDTHYAYIAADHGPDPAGSLVLGEVGRNQRRILFTPVPRQAVQQWSMVFTSNHLFWVQTDTLTPQLMRLNLSDPDATPAAQPLPVDAQTIWVDPHDAEGDWTGPLQLQTSGFLSPPQTWLIDGDAETLTYQPLTSSTQTFDKTGMEVRLHMATSDDGTQVPYHIVLPKDHAAQAGNLPILQYGYGGFGNALSPSYLRLRGPMWLEQGSAYVQSYIRGGSEFGKSWHLAAKGKNRPRAFEDFAAIASDLVKRGYSKPGKIVCNGGSNGGLLCGVMLTRYPERYGAVWASVGVLDMLRYHLFPAGAGWIDEYGDPDDPAARKWLQAYSPMHNVEDHAYTPYPPALIDTNESDDRVDPSHSRRFAATLEQADQTVWFHSRSGGHGGGGENDAGGTQSGTWIHIPAPCDYALGRINR